MNYFKIGESVRFDKYIMLVCMHKGKKMLKLAHTMGWVYVEPENWDDVKKLN